MQNRPSILFRGPAHAASNGSVPANHRLFALLFAHLRHQAQINLPNAANLIHILPYADRQSGQQRRAKRRRFDNGGPDNFSAQHIRLKLHQKLIGARAAIHA